ncbi:hypothetical protein H6G00_01775 [Leptolyngbya sp. FACHB-541]|uniref:hypothetical protein n=1 Tax=Leptolyngbya sp. FACHB-541 TaxID=2692810 RepID=UPI001682E085|nr:hypothetical protein [Leptolyngbya sp. FACHB-541]MBD1995360.1 hypothetical protein [Leptolyngbya sp. FACHB-541]
MRKTPSNLSGQIPGIPVWDWKENPINTFHLLEEAVFLFGQHKTPPTWENRNDRPESPQDYVIAWSDSGRYIGRAKAWYKKTDNGLLCLSEPVPTSEHEYWNQLDLGSVPQEVAAMVENYHAGHISVWVSTLVDVLEISDFPDNMFARERALSFSSEGTLLFKWGNHVRAFKPIGCRGYQGSGWEGVARKPNFPRGLNYEPAKPYPRSKSAVPVT